MPTPGGTRPLASTVCLPKVDPRTHSPSHPPTHAPTHLPALQILLPPQTQVQRLQGEAVQSQHQLSAAIAREAALQQALATAQQAAADAQQAAAGAQQAAAAGREAAGAAEERAEREREERQRLGARVEEVGCDQHRHVMQHVTYRGGPVGRYWSLLTLQAVALTRIRLMFVLEMLDACSPLTKPTFHGTGAALHTHVNVLRTHPSGCRQDISFPLLYLVPPVVQLVALNKHLHASYLPPFAPSRLCTSCLLLCSS